jgi:hypothetical protein
MDVLPHRVVRDYRHGGGSLLGSDFSWVTCPGFSVGSKGCSNAVENNHHCLREEEKGLPASRVGERLCSSPVVGSGLMRLFFFLFSHLFLILICSFKNFSPQ